MPFDKFVDMKTVSEERRKAIHGSLETMSLVDLQQLVKELSEFEGDPWQENFVSAIEAHPEASFYRAVTQEGAIILYCPGDETGVWFLPGSGMVPCRKRPNEIREKPWQLLAENEQDIRPIWAKQRSAHTIRRNQSKLRGNIIGRLRGRETSFCKAPKQGR